MHESSKTRRNIIIYQPSEAFLHRFEYEMYELLIREWQINARDAQAMFLLLKPLIWLLKSICFLVESYISLV
jgi:hypothetical protein